MAKVMNDGSGGHYAQRPEFKIEEYLQTLNSSNIYTRPQIEKYTKFSRFGYFDPYNTNSVTREYLFFTKMDLHIFDDGGQTLQQDISNNPFFIECYQNYRNVLNQLQIGARSEYGYSPFVNLLSNTVSSKLDMQDISISTMETAANIAGTKLEYPLATTDSNNLYDFNLEFEDTKFLDVYMYFRIWYEYELLKRDGTITPLKKYIRNKIIHDQMCCYKFIVGEDFETIMFYSKLWGVYPTSIPRGSYSDVADGPLKLPVSFKSQWVEDMDPNILSDFNKLVQNKINPEGKDIPIYNPNTGGVDGRWCTTPHIVTSTLNGRRVYKLKWR